MITFYDIPSQLPNKAWSPNTWKTRYCLNYKQLPYKTEWIEYPDIEPFCKKNDIPPTGKKKDGSPYYTLPAIHDSTTGLFVVESFEIALYLDKTYPDTPILIPPGTEMLQHAFLYAHDMALDALWAFVLPIVALKLNPVSEEYFTRTRSKSFGKPLQEVFPTGEEAKEAWKQSEKGHGIMDKWFQKNGGKKFVMGDKPTFPDFVLAGDLIWLKLIWGEDDQKWKDLSSWNGGRWTKVLENVKEYETIV